MATADNCLFRPIPNSPQEHFFTRAETDVFYGGAAGGGKTVALLNFPVRDLMMYPGSQAIFFRREFPQLRDVINDAMHYFVSLGAQYNEGKHVFTFPNGSRYYFAHMQHEKSKYNYQGLEFQIICFDELCHFTETQYTYLFSRLRSGKFPGMRWKMRSASNPGGIGGSWIKQRYIDRLRPYLSKYFKRVNGDDIEVHPETPHAISRAFIPAKVYDNPYLVGTSYIDNLMALPDNERKALLDGDWDTYDGQFFPMWRKGIHVVEPFSIPPHWHILGSYDYGFRSPAAYCLFAADFDGNVYLIDEMYKTESTIKEQAAYIAGIEKGHDVRVRLADPSIFARQRPDQLGNESVAKDFQKYQLSFVRANNDRLNGWAEMKEFLSWEGEYDGSIKSIKRLPRLRIFSTCVNAIREIAGAIYAPIENRISVSAVSREDLDTRQNDHTLDSIRYFVRYIYKPAKPVTVRKGWREEVFSSKGNGTGFLDYSQ